MTETAERLREARERDEAAAQDETPAEGSEVTSEAQDKPQQAPKPPSEAQIEKRLTSAWNQAQQKAEGYVKLLGGSEGDLIQCPNCDVPGYLFVGRPMLEGDRLLAVKASIGEEDVRAYRRADNAVECEACNGYGKLVRPTKVPDQMIAVCPTCNGYGWHSPMQQAPTYTPPTDTGYYVPPPGPSQYGNSQPVYTGPPAG